MLGSGLGGCLSHYNSQVGRQIGSVRGFVAPTLLVSSVAFGVLQAPILSTVMGLVLPVHLLHADAVGTVGTGEDQFAQTIEGCTDWRFVACRIQIVDL
jgi:hypothetical protein